MSWLAKLVPIHFALQVGNRTVLAISMFTPADDGGEDEPENRVVSNATQLFEFAEPIGFAIEPPEAECHPQNEPRLR